MDTMPKEKLLPIAIPEGLHRRLKALAAMQGKKIREIVYPALEELVSTGVTKRTSV